MKTIQRKSDHCIEVKKSKFLSFVLPYAEFESCLQNLKDLHPKAVHFVYAYRHLENGQIVERFSDDGEPKGSAGMPILNVLRGYDLIECASIVVRYFGGVLLGVGGLVRAYTQSVVEGIRQAQDLLQEYIQKERCRLQCTFKELGKIQYLARKMEIEIQKESFGVDEVSLELLIPLDKKEAFFQAYREN